MDGVMRDLVDANRILAAEGILDAFGHVSARHPSRPDQFLIARSRSPALVGREDLQVYDLNGAFVGGADGDGYAERAIHAAIYRARPDVHSVCHSHAPSVVAFSVSDMPLRPVWHTAALIGADIPVWDISEDFGATDLLVRSAEQGDALARRVGDRRAALMRGHGSVSLGRDIREAVQVAHGLEHNASVQQRAMAMGGTVTYLGRDEVDACTAMLRADLVRDRTWEYWRVRAGVLDGTANGSAAEAAGVVRDSIRVADPEEIR